MNHHQDKAARETDQKTRRPTNEEDLLDKAVEDTFPASDPLSVTRAPKEKRETVQPPPSAAEHDKRD